jgi:hypothetical protein
MRTKSNFLFFKICLAFFCAITFLHLNAQPNYKLQGQVIDYDTKEPIKGVSVIVRENKQGTVTNDSGYFNLSLSIPDVTLNLSNVGYMHLRQEVHLGVEKGLLTFILKKRANEQLDEVVVNANPNSARLNAVEMNTIKINPELIKRAPLLLGEADIIKALMLQPGITTTGEGAGGFNVRGGNADQNLVLLDGAPLFNTSHLLGFYTSISPDAIQDITLYKGGMPAPYGGRLSSLLNIKTKTGNNNEMQYNGGISPMSGRFYANGPIIKNKLNFIGGFRAAYPNFILNQLSDRFGSSRAFFYDGLVKTEFTLNAANKISITGYRSYDRFRFDESTSYEWLSNLASLNYVSELSSRLSLKLNGNYSEFFSTINNFESGYQYKLNSSIAQKEIKASFAYQAGDKNKIEAGANAIMYSILPGKQRPAADTSSIIATDIEKEKGREVALFLTDEINFSDKISLHAGVRYAVYDYLGPKKTYRYDEAVPLSKETITDTVSFSKNKSIQQYAGLEPRVSLKIGFKDDLALKVSYNRGQQFLQLISNTTSISPVDFWKLSDSYINRQVGDQFAAGIFKTYNNSQYLVSVEAYYKTLKNVVQYKDGGRLLLNPFIESALLNSRGRAYGIEFSFSKNIGKFTGQVNYTYSKAEVQVLTKFAEEIVNDGAWYPSDYDRPHNLAIITRLALGRGWSFNGNFVLISGRTTTYPDGNYAYNGTLVNNFSKRNMDRLPAYHRMDVGFSYISKRFAQQKNYSIWNFSFYNLYMHKNAYSIFFKRNPDALFFARVHDSLIPYRLSVVGSIIPSISWNYYF